MSKWCACFHTAPTARCKTCPLYKTPKARKDTCGAHAVLNSNDPVARQDVWCPLPYGHSGAHVPEPEKKPLIVGHHPKREQGNVAMDDDDPRWTDGRDKDVTQ